MTTVPHPTPYKILPVIIVDKLFVSVDIATRIFPPAMSIVVAREPVAVPNASKTMPPRTGLTVLTMDTVDCNTAY